VILSRGLIVFVGRESFFLGEFGWASGGVQGCLGGVLLEFCLL